MVFFEPSETDGLLPTVLVDAYAPAPAPDGADGGHSLGKCMERIGSWDRIRTCDLAIMSRLLYH